MSVLNGTAVNAARADASSGGIGILRGMRPCAKSRVCAFRGFTFRPLSQGTMVSEHIRPLMPRLTAIAEIQADLWSDSILEGPFEAEPAIVLDAIEGVYDQKQLVAYRITYSSRAWRIGPKGVRLEEGRIRESAFVAVSLKGFFRDERAIAEFQLK